MFYKIDQIIIICCIRSSTYQINVQKKNQQQQHKMKRTEHRKLEIFNMKI
jgi:hypothetical protein